MATPRRMPRQRRSCALGPAGNSLPVGRTLRCPPMIRHRRKRPMLVEALALLLATACQSGALAEPPATRVFRVGTAPLASAEIFDPAPASSGFRTLAATMGAARSGHTATLRADGTVLIAGGDSAGTAELFDPASESFSPSLLRATHSQHKGGRSTTARPCVCQRTRISQLGTLESVLLLLVEYNS